MNAMFIPQIAKLRSSPIVQCSTGGLYRLNEDQIAARGARMARRDD
jgi:hypothetical protein